MSEMNERVEEPQEQPSEPRPLREVSPEELKNILEAHRKWVESEGKEGERADLFEANLQEADLFEANLQGAYLHRADLQGADLREANLQKARLSFAQLQGTDLQGADLRWADLRGSNGLTASQVKEAKNWELALYNYHLLKELGLPPDHNERVEKKLAELENKEKTPAKP